MLKPLNKLKIYQIGLIMGVAIPTITLLLGWLGSKTFEFSTISRNSDIEGSSLMLLGTIFMICRGLLNTFALWIILGGCIGLLMQLTKTRIHMFNIVKLFIGIFPILFGVIFLFFVLYEYYHLIINDLFYEWKNLPYYFVLLSISIISVGFGVAIIRMKTNNCVNRDKSPRREKGSSAF